jgi:carbon monoxide dehydrogenase subunit G
VQSPVPFNLWIQVLPVDEQNSKMKLTLKAELNPFIKSMVEKPLQDGLEKIADALSKVHYV